MLLEFDGLEYYVNRSSKDVPLALESSSSKRHRLSSPIRSRLGKASKTNNYDAGIDAVRFVAFLLVFIHHFVYLGGNSISEFPNTYWVNPYIDSVARFGAEGVTIFFCLSGYLLSKLLIKELSDTGNISIRSFYIRRVLRIWPLYFAFIGFCLLAAPLLGNQTIKTTELPSLISFTYNWQQIFTGQSRGMAAILWSISIEEQIYLVLPILLLVFFKIGNKKLPIFLIFIGFLSRCFLFINEMAIYRNTFSYFSTVGIGMFYAINENKIKLWYRRNKLTVNFIFSSLIVIYILLFKSFFSKGFSNVIAFDLTALVAIFLLIMLGEENGKLKGTLLKPFSYLGRRSYGMYIYHWPILGLMVSKKIFFNVTTGISIGGLIFAFALVTATSTISYHFFEKPFLDLRRRYQYIKLG